MGIGWTYNTWESKVTQLIQIAWKHHQIFGRRRSLLSRDSGSSLLGKFSKVMGWERPKTVTRRTQSRHGEPQRKNSVNLRGSSVALRCYLCRWGGGQWGENCRSARSPSSQSLARRWGGNGRPIGVRFRQNEFFLPQGKIGGGKSATVLLRDR